MSEKDNREPVEQRHVDFARALVAVAREHGVRSLKAQFYGGGMGQPWTEVSMQWSEGRHSDRSRISLRAEAIHHCTEVADLPDQHGAS